MPIPNIALAGLRTHYQFGHADRPCTYYGRANTPVNVDPPASTLPTCSSVAEHTHPSVTPVEPFFPRICSEIPWVFDFSAVLGALKSLVGMINRNNNTNNYDNGNTRHGEIILARQYCCSKPYWYLFIVKNIPILIGV